MKGTTSVLGSSRLNPRFFDSGFTHTQTIDLNTLFPSNVTESGSFDVREVRKTTFARLLDAIPIPSVLLHGSNSVAFSNEAFLNICGDRPDARLVTFPQMLVKSKDQHTCKVCLAKIRQDRKPQVMEGLIGGAGRRIWGKIHMRSVRMGDDRFVLILIEAGCLVTEVHRNAERSTR
jgi:hypothetical protein